MGYPACCSVGGVLSVDWKTIRKLGRKNTICYDNDFNEAGLQLLIQAQDHFTVSAFTTPGIDSDSDSFIKNWGNDYKKAYKEFKKLVALRKEYPQKISSLKGEVENIRLMEGTKGGLKRFQVYRQVSELIISNLQDTGKFYRDESFGYYFDTNTKTLLKINKESEELRFALRNYGFEF